MRKAKSHRQKASEPYAPPVLWVHRAFFRIIDPHSAILFSALFHLDDLSYFRQGREEEQKPKRERNPNFKPSPWFAVGPNDLQFLHFPKTILAKSFRILRERKFIEIDADGRIRLNLANVEAATR